MRRTVIVTGASGFVGSCVERVLSQRGWQVIKVVHSDERGPGVQIDLAGVSVGDELRRLPQAEAVVHLAARVGWGGVSLSEMFRPNVLATGELASLCAERGMHLLYASAATVCGATAERIAGQTPVDADTPYTYSKWLGEEMVLASEASACVLRIAGVFGMHGPSHLGLNAAIAGALARRPPTLVGEGTARRSYIYVEDLAMQIAAVLETRLAGVHLAAGKRPETIRAMLLGICDVLLPGSEPQRVEGVEAVDQVVVPSPSLPPVRSFLSALADIRSRAEAEKAG